MRYCNEETSKKYMCIYYSKGDLHEWKNAQVPYSENSRTCPQG